MKRLGLAAAVLALTLVLAGCKAADGTFTNSDGTFTLSPGGGYTQTFPTRTDDGDKDKNGRKVGSLKNDPFDSFPNSGTWRLLSPFQVELSGVRHTGDIFRSGSYTLVVSPSQISGFDHILAKQK